MPVAVGMLVSQTWFKPGYFIAQGDIAPFIRTSVAAEHTWAWNHDLTGAGSPTFQIVKAFEVLAIRGVGLVGGGEVTAQRVFLALLTALVAGGGACFARCFTTNSKAVALAGIFACLNVFVLTQIPNPLILASIGLMGVAGSLVLRAAQGERVSPILLAAVSVGFSYLLINAPLLVVAGLWVVALVGLGNALGGPGGTRRAVVLMLRALPWALALNLWWIVPALPTFLGGSAPSVAVSTDIRAWSWTHVRGSIANVLALNGMWIWSYPEYVPTAAKLDRSWWAWLAFVPPLACFTAPVVAVARQRMRSAVLLGGALVLVLVGKGVHPPLAALNLWIYDHIPGFWLLREPMAKVGAPLVLIYSALIAIAMTGLLERFASRHPVRQAALAMAGVAAVLFPYPLWNGTLIPEHKPMLPSAHVRLPQEWRAAAAYLNAEPVDGKALVLPLADFYQVPTTWGYYGVDAIPATILRRPTIQPLPEQYFTEPPTYVQAAKAVEQDLLDGNLEPVPVLLRALGVSHVLVRHDLDRSFPGRFLPDPARIQQSLSESSSVRSDKSFGIVDVYTVSGSSGFVQIQDDSDPASLRPAEMPDLTWRRHNPSRYSARVSNVERPFTLKLAESFDPGWKLANVPENVTANHVQVDGYANGWLIKGTGTYDLTIEYAPARWARWAIAASSVAAFIAVATVVVKATSGVLRLRRRSRPAEPDDEVHREDLRAQCDGHA